MKHTFYLTMALVTFWLLLSGHYTPFVLACGGFSILVTVYIALRMDVVDDEAQPIHLTWRIMLYWLWLTKEVILSNIDVCRRIWSPHLEISPTLICIDASQTSPLGIMLYANSITVTPGTVCINVEGNKLEVHALTWSAAQDLLEGEMDRLISQLEI